MESSSVTIEISEFLLVGFNSKLSDVYLTVYQRLSGPK